MERERYLSWAVTRWVLEVFPIVGEMRWGSSCSGWFAGLDRDDPMSRMEGWCYVIGLWAG